MAAPLQRLRVLPRHRRALTLLLCTFTAPLPCSVPLRSMLFGFKSADYLKVSTISYSPDSAQWKSYFDRATRSGAWQDAIYTKKGGDEAAEDERAAALAGAAAVAVMLAPFGFLAYKTLL